jgi:hypothetical protein
MSLVTFPHILARCCVAPPHCRRRPAATRIQQGRGRGAVGAGDHHPPLKEVR